MSVNLGVATITICCISSLVNRFKHSLITAIKSLFVHSKGDFLCVKSEMWHFEYEQFVNKQKSTSEFAEIFPYKRRDILVKTLKCLKIKNFFQKNP